MAMVMTQKSEQPVATAHMSKRTAKVFQITIISLVLAVGLVLSVVFPFGVGVMLFLGLLVVTGALLAVGISCAKLFKAILGPSVSFGYNPSMSYLAGRKKAPKKPEDEKSEKKDDEQETG